MPRWPRGLHPQVVRNTGAQVRRVRVNGMEFYNSPVRADLELAATVVLNSAGAGFATIPGPVGFGNYWETAQVQVQTTTGPSDTSACIVYRAAISLNLILAQTSQGGGDTFSFQRRLDPGDSVIAVWSGGNPGDTATLTLLGEQVALG